MPEPPSIPEAVRLAYSEAGSGDPLVLLHGLGSSQRDWQLQVPALAPHYRLILADLRGHGLSPRPPGPYRMRQFAADVAQLLARLQAWPAHVLGLSLGGAVALQLAVDHPGLVRSLILVNTLPRFITTTWRLRLTGLRRLLGTYLFGMDKLAADVAATLFPQDEQQPLRQEARARLAANDPAAYRSCLWALARYDVTPELHRITCPVLVVAGARDATLSLVARRRLAQQLPNARLQVVIDSGHATPIDQASQFNDLVIGFLRSPDHPAHGE